MRKDEKSGGRGDRHQAPGRQAGHGSRDDQPRYGKAHLRPDGEPWRVQEKKPKLLQATLWGTHAVQEAWLNPARRIRALYVTPLMLESFGPVLASARGLDRPEPQVIEKHDLDRRLPPGAVHQGIAVDADPLDEMFVQDLIPLGEGADRSVVVMLDQVTDPHNVGAILRSASAFGALGVIMQRRHSPEMTGVLAKAACGAVDHLPVIYETNLARALEVLQQAGYFAIALDEHATDTFASLPRRAKTVLLLGAEGAGLRQKLKEQADAHVRLPTQGAIQSLNVSNAAAISLYALTA